MTKNVVNIDDRVRPPVAAKVSEAEFVDADGLKTLFGIRRSLAYTLLGEGRIKGISLRQEPLGASGYSLCSRCASF